MKIDGQKQMQKNLEQIRRSKELCGRCAEPMNIDKAHSCIKGSSFGNLAEKYSFCCEFCEATDITGDICINNNCQCHHQSPVQQMEIAQRQLDAETRRIRVITDRAEQQIKDGKSPIDSLIDNPIQPQQDLTK